MKNYADFYAKITDPIRKNPRAVHSKANLSQLSLSPECRLSLYP